MHLPPSFNVGLIIPTGIGASIGGFGGDAMVLLPWLASFCDTVVTHPNVANAACFQSLPDNVLYVEGYGLDRFFKGEWGLKPVRQNKIGMIWDSGIPKDMETLHWNAMRAVETVYGVNMIGMAKTQSPVELQIAISESGRSAGSILNPETLLDAGQTLISQGANALAVCCLMPESADPEETLDYQAGVGVDPIAGLEAMISHLLVSQFQIPAAHAPVFPYEEALPVTDHLVDPRAASEFMVSTFLPCVLTGLARAPQFEWDLNRLEVLRIESLSALVVPANALGSLPVLSALERRIPVLAVENNETVMACSKTNLALNDGILSCANYMEAIGYLAAMKAGITLPKHFQNAVSQITAPAYDYSRA